MFDRLEFDKQTTKAREEQIAEMQKRLSEYFQYNTDIRQQSINGVKDEENIKYVQDIPIPAKGRNAVEVADELIERVLKKGINLQHPRFLTLVCTAISPYSLMGSILSDIYNLNVAGYDLAPEATIIEEKLIKWMGSCAGYPEDTVTGVFTSGGSLSNLTGMMAARLSKLTEEEYPIGIAYIHDQAHSSVRKALKLMGLRKDQIVILPTNDKFVFDTKALEEHIKQDIANGKKPFLIVGVLGSTNTGSIDRFNELADIAEKYDMWLHVDGAYGGSSLVSPIYKNLSKGIERSDSLTWDTHKWLMQTYACSTIIFKNRENALNIFSEHPEYLADVTSADHNDGWDRGIEMSRPARALKLWFTLQAVGTDLIADLIDYCFYNAELAEKEFKKLDNWTIISEPSCGALNVRYEPKGYTEEELNNLNAAISKGIIESGYAYILNTTLRGKTTIRFCLINVNTTDEDVISTIKKLNEIAINLDTKNK